jgi:hypothetical protein
MPAASGGPPENRARIVTISYFVLFQNNGLPEARVSGSDHDEISAILCKTPYLLKALLHTPAVVHGPFSDDGYPPQLVLQLYFSDLPQLEAAIGPKGHLRALAAHGRFPSLAGALVTQQAMVTRCFPTPSPPAHGRLDESRCSYLVHYPGHAEDLNAWLSYYLSHHPQLMRNLPGIREVEVYTRLDWCDAMPWKRVYSMQRNKVVFDSPSALSAALDSPALHAMRDDFRKFPLFAGGNVHYAMITSTIAGEPNARASG